MQNPDLQNFHVVNSLLNPDCFAWVADFHTPHYEFDIFLNYVGSVPSKRCMTVDLYTYQSDFLSSTVEKKRPDPVGEYEICFAEKNFSF